MSRLPIVGASPCTLLDGQGTHHAVRGKDHCVVMLSMPTTGEQPAPSAEPFDHLPLTNLSFNVDAGLARSVVPLCVRGRRGGLVKRVLTARSLPYMMAERKNFAVEVQ